MGNLIHISRHQGCLFCLIPPKGFLHPGFGHVQPAAVDKVNGLVIIVTHRQPVRLGNKPGDIILYYLRVLIRGPWAGHAA